MKKEQALKLWTTRQDEDTDIELKDDDKFFQFGGFLFVVQKSGNVVLRKVKKTAFTLKEAFRGFRFFCIKNGIQYLRIEGNERRYKMLPKMFPATSFIQDEEVKDRNVFFVKVY